MRERLLALRGSDDPNRLLAGDGAAQEEDGRQERAGASSRLTPQKASGDRRGRRARRRCQVGVAERRQRRCGVAVVDGDDSQLAGRQRRVASVADGLELGQRLVGCGIAVIGVLGEQPGHHSGDGVGHRWVGVGDPRRDQVHDVIEDAAQLRRGERLHAGEHLVHDGAGGEEVGARRDGRGLDLFGRHVVRRADERTRGGEARMQRPRDAEVGDLGRSFGGEEDVGRLDVAMDDAFRVRVGEAAQQIGGDAERPRRAGADACGAGGPAASRRRCTRWRGTTRRRRRSRRRRA